jgi:hypothetical protein
MALTPREHKLTSKAAIVTIFRCASFILADFLKGIGERKKKNSEQFRTSFFLGLSFFVKIGMFVSDSFQPLFTDM